MTETNLPQGRVKKYICIPQQRGLRILSVHDIDDLFARKVINTYMVFEDLDALQVFDGWVCFSINEAGLATQLDHEQIKKPVE